MSAPTPPRHHCIHCRAPIPPGFLVCSNCELAAYSAPTPPPGFDLGYCDQTTAEMGRTAQEAYRAWLDSGPGTIKDASRLEAFIDATLDVLERITGQSVPPSQTNPDNLSDDDVDYRGEH